MMKYFFSSEYPRYEEMFYLRQCGMTLRAIGERYDVTTERVRQILSKRDSMARYLPLEQERRVRSEMQVTNYASAVSSLRDL